MKKDNMKLSMFESRGKEDKGLTILFFFSVMLLIAGILLSL